MHNYNLTAIAKCCNTADWMDDEGFPLPTLNDS